jgi:zinc protease
MRTRKMMYLWLATILSGSVFAQKPLDLTAPMPVDKNVRIGKLENGLTYYIRKNALPAKRVELRLATNAGSMQETDAQVGLAHFTEHMAFNGSKNFPKNELVSYLQSIGVRFGADINAYTSFDETVYMLQIPTDKPDVVEKGYKVISDWAGFLTMDGKEIDAERGVIIEEHRMGLGAEDRMRKKWFPTAFYNSLYANRLPIGTLQNLQTFKHELIRSFYADWYRPNLQAVIVVGDVNLDSAEAKIKQYFSAFKNPAEPKEKKLYDVSGNKDPLISIVTDKEATGSMLLYFTKHKAIPNKTIGDYRQRLVNSLYNTMMNARLRELQQDPNCPFIMADASYGGFLARTMEAYMCYASPKENQIEEALKVLISKNEQVKQFGFLQTELDRAKEDLLSKYESASKEVEKNESANFCSEYVQNFLIQEPIPGAKTEFNYAKKLMDDIKIEEVNVLTKKWLTEENQVVVITTPEKQGLKIPTDKQVSEILKDVKLRNVTAYVDNFKAQPLLSKELTPKKIISKTENKELGTTEITLSNGVKVVLKPTDFKNDEILMYAQSPGGLSLTEAADYPSGFLTTTVIDRAGIGEFDNSQLEKKLKGKNISISPFLDQTSEGFNGSVSPKDIETLFQLAYLYFDAPRKDVKSFESVVSEMKNQMKLLGNNPIYAFYDTLMKTTTQNDPRQIAIPTEDFISKANYDKIWSIYKDRFSNAGDFTFFFVGAFTVEEITPLLEKYLSNLPNTGRTETFKDVYNKFPAKTIDFTIKKGADDKGMLGIIFSEDYTWNDQNNLHLLMIKEAISIKAIEIIREKMSGVYSPQIQMQIEKYPTSSYTLMGVFGCSPKMEKKITKALINIIVEIQKNGPTLVDLNKVKEQMLRQRETDAKTNEFWLRKLSTLSFNNDPITNVTNFEQRVKAVTVEDLKKAAQMMIKKDHFVRVSLVPEGKKK